MASAPRWRVAHWHVVVVCTFASLLPAPARAQGLTGFIFKRAPEGTHTSDTVTIFADGNLRSSVGKDGDATLASGALGIEVKKQTVLINGQDYYNNYYDQRLSAFRIGLATNRDRARSELPQPPRVF